jgi:hypothetical protein
MDNYDTKVPLIQKQVEVLNDKFFSASELLKYFN